MGINFPNNPSPGDKWPSPAQTGVPVWTWDGSAWKTMGGAGLGQIYIADTAPQNALAGSLWWESDTGMLYIRYDDGDSVQWVAAFPIADVGQYAVRYDVAQPLSETQTAQARANMYAAPFDAMSYNGMQYNGSMAVSQELGTTGATVSGGSKYIIDGWFLQSVGAQAIIGVQNTGATVPPPGYVACLQAYATTANAAPAAGDYASLVHNIEGYRIARLAWGTANAQPITIGFWVWAEVPGMYSGLVSNNVYTYLFTYNVVGSTVWEYKTVTIPGPTVGTWKKDNTVGITLQFTLLAGSTYTAAPGSWLSGIYVGATGAKNLAAVTAKSLLLTGVVVLPGIEAPSATRAPLIARPYDQELLLCFRYLWRFFGGYGRRLCITYNDQTISCQGVVYLPTMMRATPTLTQSNMTVSGIAFSSITVSYGADNLIGMMFNVASGLTVGGVQQVYAGNPNGWLQLDARP